MGALECLDLRMLSHVLPLLSGIDKKASTGGLRTVDCLLCGCMPVYSVTGGGFECLWGYATVLEVILNAVFVPLI